MILRWRFLIAAHAIIRAKKQQFKVYPRKNNYLNNPLHFTKTNPEPQLSPKIISNIKITISSIYIFNLEGKFLSSTQYNVGCCE